MKGALISFVAVVFLAAFASVWAWIAYKLWQFSPSPSQPVLDLGEKVVAVAGFLAASVGAGTAAFLGIEIQKPETKSFGTYVSKQPGRAAVLIAGVVVYLVVGSLIFALWFFGSDTAPDFIGTFSWGILGWGAGAFSAAFGARTP